MAFRTKRLLRVLFDRTLAKRGYALKRTGGEYIDAKSTIAAAKAAGISIHEYIYRAASAEKRGRTDRIVQRIGALFKSGCEISVAEIGTGTGMYLERLCSVMNCTAYHVFETDPGWQTYARQVLAKQTKCVVHKCDGTTLKELEDRSTNLKVMSRFREVHGPDYVDYLVCERTLPPSSASHRGSDLK